MGRPRQGSVTPRGNLWRASVPRPGQGRCETTFPSEREGWTWVRAQERRRARGLEPLLPDRRVAKKKAGRTVTDFTRLALEWYELRYLKLPDTTAERALKLKRDIELHVVTTLADLFEHEFLAGQSLIIDWLRCYSGRDALVHGDRFTKVTPGRSRTTVGGYLWALREIIKYARASGLDVPDYTGGKEIKALKPLGRAKRKAPLVTLEESARIAAHLHVVHQLAFWLMRASGLRISEAYGLLAGHFYCDAEGDGFFVVQDQGGRDFVVWDENQKPESVRHKEGLKTDAGYRVMVLPRPLTALVRAVIATFHTDGEGFVDPYARLVPSIRKDDAGQAGFRSALTRAARDAGLSARGEALEESIVPHDLRKAVATGLALDATTDRLWQRRFLGHRVGSDTFDLVYVLDSKLKRHLAVAARAIEADLVEAGVSTLMVPTVRRPLYARDTPRDQRASRDLELEQLGWQTSVPDGAVGVPEAAQLLRIKEKATRLLMGTAIPAVKDRRGWRVRVEDVTAFRDRNVGKWRLAEIAREAGVSYQETHRLMERLAITPAHDAYEKNVYILENAQAQVILGEFDRTRHLRERAVRESEAARLLGVSLAVLRVLVANGQLERDVESDASGTSFITRASIDAEAARRPRTTSRVTLHDLREIADLDETAVKALVAAGLLVRTRDDGLTTESVRRWIVGFRPDLLRSRLLERQ